MNKKKAVMTLIGTGAIASAVAYKASQKHKSESKSVVIGQTQEDKENESGFSPRVVHSGVDKSAPSGFSISKHIASKLGGILSSLGTSLSSYGEESVATGFDNDTFDDDFDYDDFDADNEYRATYIGSIQDEECCEVTDEIVKNPNKEQSLGQSSDESCES